MRVTDPLCTETDVSGKLLRPLTDFEQAHVADWIDEASAQLRQRAPFDVDARIVLFEQNVPDPAALNPLLVAGVVATVVKTFLVNPRGVASQSDSTGPFSASATYVNRYDKSGSDVRGRIEVTDADIEQLRPAVPAPKPFSFQVGIPCPQILVPRSGAGYSGRPGYGYGPVIVPDVAPGTGAE